MKAKKRRKKADHSGATPPPVITVNDRILLHYAVLNDSVGYNSGHGLMFVGEKEIGRVPCLAICQDKSSAQFTLYYCDGDWSPLGIANYDTVEAAKRRAERIYPGSFPCWIEAKFTEEDAKRYLDEAFSESRSSLRNLPTSAPILKYRSGEKIKNGDRVRFHGNPAEIEFVAWDANDPNVAWYVNEFGGGVMVRDPMVSGSTFVDADQLGDYEDLEFVSRREEEVP